MNAKSLLVLMSGLLLAKEDGRSKALGATLGQLATVTPEASVDALTYGFQRSACCPTPEGGIEGACEARRKTCSELYWMCAANALIAYTDCGEEARIIWSGWLADASSRPEDPRSEAMAATFSRELAWLSK